MGAKATFDPVTRIIKLTEAPSLIDGEMKVNLNVKVDLYSDQKEDWLTTPALKRLRPPISVIGGQTTPIGFAGNTFFMRSDWNIELYDADHILVVDGNFFKVDGKSPFTKPTGGVYSTQVDRFVSNIVDTLAVGSGLSAPQDAKLTKVHSELAIIEGVHGHGNVMRGIWAMLAGQISGAETGMAGTATIRNMANTKTRMTIDFDAEGNRTNVTFLDLT